MKKIKDSIASFLYHVLLLIVKITPAKRGKKHLLLIKTDEIGDYILFRNYFETIRKSEKYSDWKISLIGNVAWKEITDTYDAAFFDSAIWVQKKKFNRSLLYRFRTLLAVRKLGVSEVINCVYSRSMKMDDGFAFVCNARRFAMHCDDTSNRSAFWQYLDPLYYNVVHAGNKTIFDNYRNRNFIAKLLDNENIHAKTQLGTIKRQSSSDYFVIFLGAGNPERKWPVACHAEIATFINEKYGWEPVLCGGPQDKADAENFLTFYNGRITNHAGLTTLNELIELLRNAAFLLSVDTGAVHLAAAVSCPVIGLFSGKFYGRFAPYPKEIFDKLFPVYPDFVDEMLLKNDDRIYDTNYMSNDTIKEIQPEKVKEAVIDFLFLLG